MKDENQTQPEEMAAMIAEAERLMDSQTDAFQLMPELKQMRAELLRRTVELEAQWYQFGALTKLVSEGHSKQVQ